MHTDDAVDVVIIEGVVDRVAEQSGSAGARHTTFDVEPALRRAATERYNAKYSWDFEPDGDGLNFLVRPELAYAWHSTPTAVEGGTRWTFPQRRGGIRTRHPPRQ